MRRRLSLLLALIVLASLPVPSAVSQDEPELPEPIPCNGCWVPELITDWEIQFNGEIDTTLDVDMFEVDMFDTPEETVQELKRGGTGVVCYISAGSRENWRPDKADFPKSVRGKDMDGWPGEKWLDIRQIETLAPVMGARIDLCAQKGFDSVEFDNVNGYENDTGFPLTAEDQLQYNVWLANASHERGLSVGLKNSGPQAATLEPYFDWVLTEECFQYKECGPYKVFVENGKPVMSIEYTLKRAQFCERAKKLNYNAMKKKLNLNAFRRPCPPRSELDY